VESLDQGRVDALIWKHAGVRPVREIAEMAGVRPDEVLRRKNELLEEVDVLTIQQKRQKLLIELDGIARDARKRAEGATDEMASGLWNSSISAIKTLLQELSRMEKADGSKVEALNQLRIRELLSLIDRTVVRSVSEIASEHDLEEGDLLEVFQGHLVEAASEVQVE